jgi:hypothetical protein
MLHFCEGAESAEFHQLTAMREMGEDDERAINNKRVGG